MPKWPWTLYVYSYTLILIRRDGMGFPRTAAPLPLHGLIPLSLNPPSLPDRSPSPPRTCTTRTRSTSSMSSWKRSCSFFSKSRPSFLPLPLSVGRLDQKGLGSLPGAQWTGEPIGRTKGEGGGPTFPIDAGLFWLARSPLARLGSRLSCRCDEGGLTTDEATRRLDIFGPNKLTEKEEK